MPSKRELLFLNVAMQFYRTLCLLGNGWALPSSAHQVTGLARKAGSRSSSRIGPMEAIGLLGRGEAGRLCLVSSVASAGG